MSYTDAEIIAHFRARLSYDLVTGKFTPKKGRTPQHIWLGGKSYSLTEIAWALSTGVVPKVEIYRINRGKPCSMSNLTDDPSVLDYGYGSRSPRAASILHLIDLKRAGHSPKRTELDIPAKSTFVPKFIDSPRSSYCGSSAALCAGEW